jgi:hypothetical protein
VKRYKRFSTSSLRLKFLSHKTFRSAVKWKILSKDVFKWRKRIVSIGFNCLNIRF